MGRIYFTPTEYHEFAEPAVSLGQVIASRERSIDFHALAFFLPNLDPILKAEGKDISVYQDLLIDAHVASTVESRQAAILSNEYLVQPADSSRAARKAADRCRAALSRLDAYHVMEQTLNAVLYGYEIQEVVWEDLEREWLPASIEEKPQHWFTFDPQGRLRFLSWDNVQGEILPDRYHFLLSQKGATYANPYGQAVLARCFWPVAFKKGGLRFWVMFTEKYGMPWPIGKYQPGATEEEKNNFLELLHKMVADGVAVIPSNGTVELLNTGSQSASADIYDKLVAFCDASISKAVLGQTLTTEVGETGGAYAASQTHQEVRYDIADRDKKIVRRAFNTLFRWITELNQAGAPAPELIFVEEEDVRKDQAERDEKLRAQGVRFKKSYFIRTYNLPEEEFDLVEPERMNPTAPFQPGGSPAASAGAFAASSAAAAAAPVGVQPELVELRRAALAEAATVLPELLAPVIRLIRGAASLEDVQDRLFSLYPDLPVEKLADALARAMFAAGLAGRDSTGRRRFADEAGWQPLPPEEAIRYFQAKGNRLTWSWREMWQREHATAFTVAHCQRLDILADIRAAVDRAIADGLTFQQFQEQLTPILKAKGWWGEITEAGPGGREETYQAGSPRRLRTIFDTNLAVAYATGQDQANRENADVAPYWLYDAGNEGNTCEICQALDGKVFRYDDPVWSRIRPPNHWHCNCGITPLSADQAQAMGLTIESGADEAGEIKPEYAELAQPEWNYNPADSRLWDLRGELPDAEPGGPSESGTVLAPLPDQRTWSDFGRPDLRDVPAEQRQEVPELLAPGKDAGEALDILKKALGIDAAQPVRRIQTPVKEVELLADYLPHLVEKRLNQRERFARFLLPTLEHPFEVWAVRYEDGIRLRYIGLFRGQHDLMVVIRENRDGSLVWNFLPASDKKMNRNRIGEMLYGQ